MISVTTKPTSGVELGYAEITSDFTTTSTTPVDVTGLSTTVNTGGPVIIEVFAPGWKNSGANGGILVSVWEDSTQVAVVAGNFINLASASEPMIGKVRRVPTVGAHTYKVTAQATISGTVTINANTGVAANTAAYIRVTNA